MDFLGIGPLELLFVLLIAFLVLGPDNLEKTGRSLGRMLKKINQSETWGAVKSVTKEIQQLPTKLMRDASVEEFQKEQSARQIAPPSKSTESPQTPEDLEAGLQAWITPPNPKEDS